jgi:hypothetical protein
MCDVNDEQVREAFHASHDSVFAMIEQLQMPGCDSILAVTSS